MVILTDMTLCRVNKNNGVVIEERKIPMRKQHEYPAAFEMDKVLDRYTRIFFPGKEINASFKTIKTSQMIELQHLMNETGTWSDKTFGDGKFSQSRSISISYHLQKEAKELTEALEKYFSDPSDANTDAALEEFADVILLLLDSAGHFGMSARQMIMEGFKKLEINKKRQWGKPDEHGVVEHVR